MRTALIFGRAMGVWDEVKAAMRLGHFKHVIGVGSAGVDFPGVFDTWVSFHASLFPHWCEQRLKKGFPLPRRFVTSTHKGMPVPARLAPTSFSVDYVFCEGGSSGLVAVMAALNLLDANRVVLCGIPMDPAAAGYDREQTPWDEAIMHRVAWTRDIDLLKGRVRSMSGWSQQLLGGEPPTEEWLAQPDRRAA